MSKILFEHPKQKIAEEVYDAVHIWIKKRENEAKHAEKILNMYKQADITQFPTDSPILMMLLIEHFERKDLYDFLNFYDGAEAARKQDLESFLAKLIALRVKTQEKIIEDCNIIVRAWRNLDLESEAVLKRMHYLVNHASGDKHCSFEQNVLQKMKDSSEKAPQSVDEQNNNSEPVIVTPPMSKTQKLKAKMAAKALKLQQSESTLLQNEQEAAVSPPISSVSATVNGETNSNGYEKSVTLPNEKLIPKEPKLLTASTTAPAAENESISKIDEPDNTLSDASQAGLSDSVQTSIPEKVVSPPMSKSQKKKAKQSAKLLKNIDGEGIAEEKKVVVASEQEEIEQKSNERVSDFLVRLATIPAGSELSPRSNDQPKTNEANLEATNASSTAESMKASQLGNTQEENKKSANLIEQKAAIGENTTANEVIVTSSTAESIMSTEQLPPASVISGKIAVTDLDEGVNAESKVQLEQKAVNEGKPEQLVTPSVVSESQTSDNEQKKAWPGANQPALESVTAASSPVSANTLHPTVTKTQKKNAKKAAKLLREASLNAQEGAENGFVAILPDQKGVTDEIAEMLATILAKIETQEDANNKTVSLEQRVMGEKKDSELHAAKNETSQSGLDVAGQPSTSEIVKETELNENSDAKDEAVAVSLEQRAKEEKEQLATTSVVSVSHTSDNGQKKAWPGANQPALEIVTTVLSPVSAITSHPILTKTQKKNAKKAAKLLREASSNAKEGAEDGYVAIFPEDKAVRAEIAELLATILAKIETQEDTNNKAVTLEQRVMGEKKDSELQAAENETSQSGSDVAGQPSTSAIVKETELNENSDAKDKAVEISSEQRAKEEREQLATSVVSVPHTSNNGQKKAWPGTIQPALAFVTSAPSSISTSTLPPPLTKTQKKNAKKAAKLLREASLNAQEGAEDDFVAILPEEKAVRAEIAELLTILAKIETPENANNKAVQLKQREIVEKKESELQAAENETSQNGLNAAGQPSTSIVKETELNENSDAKDKAVEVSSEQKAKEEREQLATSVVSVPHTSNNGQKKAWPGANQPALEFVTTAPSSLSTSTLPPPLTKTQKKNAKKAAKLLREASLNAQEGAEDGFVASLPEDKAVSEEIAELLVTILAEIETQEDSRPKVVQLERREMGEKKDSELQAAENETKQSGLNAAGQPSTSEIVKETELKKPNDVKDKTVEVSSKQKAKQLATTSVIGVYYTSDDGQKKAWPGANQPALEIVNTAPSSIPTSTLPPPLTKTQKKNAKKAAKLLREASLNALDGAEDSVVAVLPEDESVEEETSESMAATSVISQSHTNNDRKENAWPAVQPAYNVVATASSSVSANTSSPLLTKTQKKNLNKAAKRIAQRSSIEYSRRHGRAGRSNFAGAKSSSAKQSGTTINQFEDCITDSPL